MEQCSESGGSVINWPPGLESGSEFVTNIRVLIILSRIQRNVKKVYISIVFDNIFSQWPQKCSGRIQIGTRNKLASQIRIHKPGLRIRRSESVRNIYGCGTLLEGFRYGSGTPTTGMYNITRCLCFGGGVVWCGMPGGQEATIWSDMYHEPKD